MPYRLACTVIHEANPLLAGDLPSEQCHSGAPNIAYTDGIVPRTISPFQGCTAAVDTTYMLPDSPAASCDSNAVQHVLCLLLNTNLQLPDMHTISMHFTWVHAQQQRLSAGQ